MALVKTPSKLPRVLSIAIFASHLCACEPSEDGTAPGGQTGPSSMTRPAVALRAGSTVVASGGTTVLSWASANTGTCTASGAWSGSQAASGTQLTGVLSASATYTLTCSGPGGPASDTVIVQVAPNAPTAASCTSASGTMSLKANATRAAGISPFLVFFDATGTTDSAITGGTTAFQDVYYSWNFGDNGASGTETWSYGSNPDHNSRNLATGGVAAHLYVAPGADTPYVVTVTAHNGTSTASCQLGVKAYSPSGRTGFAGNKTTCVSAAGTPAAGSGGCPAGAAVLHNSSFNSALASSYFGNGKRVLFKCGDTFSGDGALLNGTTWSVGAYGGCEGTKSGRPIFHDPGGNGALIVGYTAGDGRIADLDFEGANTGSAAVTTLGGNAQINYRITLYNLNSTGNSASYAWSQGAQWGLIDSVMNGMRTSIGTFVNYNENNPATWSGNVFNNLDYQAILGNLLNGQGSQSTGGGLEVLRLSACRLCAIENNTIENANNVGGVLKLHNGNTNNSVPTWSGVYTELIEISDNLFGGTSGGELVDIEPQNNLDDERLRNLVFERNLLTGSTGSWGGNQLRTSVANETIRGNVFLMNSGGRQIYPQYGLDVGQLGIEPVPTGVEIYNNTCYIPTPQDNLQGCIALNGFSMHAPPQTSYAKNNMLYAVSGTHAMILDKGADNAVGNNSTSSSDNPAFTNSSGSFSVLPDFKPTANYAGGTRVPVWYDAMGIPWPSSWDLGALQH